MYKLYLPSLDTRNKVITVDNLSKTEAEAFLNYFDYSVSQKRKLGLNPTRDYGIPSLVQYFTGSIDLQALDDDGELDNLVENLMTSRIPQKRGRRAVLIDAEKGEIGVGTTVVYNQNWAMKGVQDDSISQALLAVAATQVDDSPTDPHWAF